MTVHMVRYEVKPDHIEELEAAVGEVFAAVHAERPEGVSYTMLRLSDGVTLVGLLALADGVPNPLPDIPAARRLQERLPDWVVGGPVAPEPLEILGSYRFFRDSAG
jgi:hypothetical protein